MKGAITPRMSLRKGLGHSPLDLVIEEKSLMDKLSHVADIAAVRDAGQERRATYQRQHSRGDERRRTQPVTLKEIRIADS